MAYGILAEYLSGQTIEAYSYFGAHFTKENQEVEIEIPLKKDPSKTKKTTTIKLVNGVMFRLYAPMASDVSVIGDFNNWDPTIHKMKKIDDAGVFELFIPGLHNYASF